MNKVILIGRLARDVELRATTSNISVAQFTIAVSRPYNPEKEQQETDFINCVVWRKQAENLAKYCHKGSQIAVEGRIQTRNYTAQDGNKRYLTEVLCDNITYLSHSNQNSTSEPSDRTALNSTEQQEDPFKTFGEEVVINDDDLPFD